MLFDEDKLKGIILQNAKMVEEDGIEFKDDMSLEEQLGLDSLQMVEIVVSIEEQFHVELNYVELIDAIRNYGELKKYVASLC